jgi:hypothetical protein
MVTPSRTLGPLHLEDLDPHRFEDLVRQLLYDFRQWRSLEATGRSGGDEGFDARGWEAIGRPPQEEDRSDDDDEEALGETSDDRLWLIQCKREKKIGPTKLLGYLDEMPEEERNSIYGIVFAAATDFSKKARDGFRQKAGSFGVSEVHLWGKGEIEDQLFQPKNDHLLFAYFSVSLQTRRRTVRTQVRARLAMKRKAKRVLEHRAGGPVLIRDATDDRYPSLDPNEKLDRIDRGSWKVYNLDWQCIKSDGIHVQLRRCFAFIDDDGEHWDYAERTNDARVSSHEDPWPLGPEKPWEVRAEDLEVWNALPEKNRAWFEISLVLPYDNIIDIAMATNISAARIYTRRSSPLSPGHSGRTR